MKAQQTADHWGNLVREERDREEFYHLLLQLDLSFCREGPAGEGKMLVYQERTGPSQLFIVTAIV